MKCVDCGRDGIQVSRKGYIKRHLTPGGIPCHFCGVPARLIEHVQTADTERRKRASKIGAKA